MKDVHLVMVNDKEFEDIRGICVHGGNCSAGRDEVRAVEAEVVDAFGVEVA